MTELRKKILSSIKRIVVKVGTSVLSGEHGRLDPKKVSAVVDQICCIKDRGIDAIVVSSGAIGAGMWALGLKARPTSLSHKQAAAAIGQIQLMKLYEGYFKARAKRTAQVLLTQDDFSDRKRYINAKHTLFTILDYEAIPIINENDTVATEEIKVGDNDKLSGLVCHLAEAGLLIILSDVDGLLDEHKHVINIVDKVTPEIERLARGTTKQTSTGGMITKLNAAKMATENHARCIIANGHTENIICRILNAENIGTLFL